MGEGLRRATHPAGGVAGADGRLEGGDAVPRCEGVAREVGSRAEPGVLEQGLRARAVQLQALGREQVVGDRLGEQGVAELVAAVSPRLEDVVLDGGPERGPQLRRVDTGDALEERVRDPTADDRSDPDDRLGGLVELVHAGQEQAGEVPGVAPDGARRGRQLLGEERVPLGAAGHLVDDVLREGRAGIVDDPAHVGVGQRAQLDPAQARKARPHGQRAREGVPAVDVVAAVGDQEADAVGAASGEEEGQQLPRGLVGPVHVLDDGEHRCATPQVGERAVHGLDEVGAHGIPPGACGEPRDEGDQAWVGGDELVDEPTLPRVEPGEHLDEGEVREARCRPRRRSGRRASAAPPHG